MFASITLASALLLQGDWLEKVTLDVNGVQRQFLAHIPRTKDARARPVVFTFHGHGGNMRNAANKFAIHKHWPEAVSIYMEGLPTTGITDPEGKKNGWQKTPGDYEDRDIKFFDKVNEWVHTKAKIDDQAIFCTGHSNGGAFTYLLWSTHPKLFRAIAPSAAGGKAASGTEPVTLLHMTGKDDKLVSAQLQQRTVDRLKRVNQCELKGTPLGNGITKFESKVGKHVSHYVFDGGHTMPDNLAPMIVKFFKETL